MCVYIHTYTYTYIHTHIHRYMSSMYPHTRSNMHDLPRATRTWCVDTLAEVHLYVCVVSMYLYMRIKRTLFPTCMHAYIHTYVCAHIHRNTYKRNP